MAPVPQEGMIVAITGSSGLVEFSQDQPYDVHNRTDKQRIPFQLSEVGTAVQMGLLALLLL